MTKLHVRCYMTASPLTIGREQTLAAAQELMHAHNIRHLPVLEGGKLAGMVSERDLALIQALPGVDPQKVLVEEAMTADVYTISPSSSLEWVATEMAQRKCGSAVVIDHDKVVGVFTTIDALQALGELLADARRTRTATPAKGTAHTGPDSRRRGDRA